MRITKEFFCVRCNRITEHKAIEPADPMQATTVCPCCGLPTVNNLVGIMECIQEGDKVYRWKCTKCGGSVIAIDWEAP